MNFWSDKEKKCLLISDGSYISTRLLDTLLFQNCHVFYVKNLFKDENLDKFSNNKNFTLKSFDITKNLPPDLPKVDYIFYLAGLENLSKKSQNLDQLIINSVGINNFLDKSTEDGSKFLLISSVYISGVNDLYEEQPKVKSFDIHSAKNFNTLDARKYAEALVIEYFQTKNLDARIARIGDCYGPGMDISQSDIIPKMIGRALNLGQIEIEGDGLSNIYPTYISDVVYGLAKAMFSQNTNGKILNIADSKFQTVLGFANYLKNVLHENGKEINFSYKDTKGPFIPKLNIDIEDTENEISWLPKVTIEKGLAETIQHILTLKPDDQKGEKISVANEDPGKKCPKFNSINISFAPKPVVKIMVATMIVFILIFVPLFASSILGYFFLSRSQSSCISRKFENCQNQAKKSTSLFLFAKGELDLISSGLRLVKIDSSFQNTRKVIDASRRTSVAISYLAKDGTKIESSLKKIIKKEAKVEDLRNDITAFQTSISGALREIDMASLEISEVESLPFGIFAGRFSGSKEKLSLTKNLLVASDTFVKSAPYFLGFDEKRRYLILLQNNYELRPTGGFIGSYGEIVFDKGNLESIKIDDIYNIDGQLKEKFPAPEPIKTNLGQDRWFLRDSNWNPDFPTSARTAEEFYLKETGKKIDGVIALDVDFVGQVIDSIGSIQIPEHEKLITSENLFDEAEFNSEIDFVPGSTAKKDFLTLLGGQLVDKLVGFGPEINMQKLLKSTNTALLEKHLLLYFGDPQLESLLVDQNYAGALANINAGKEIPDTDYLFVVDSNVGANKANRFIEKEIFYNPIIKRDGDMRSVLAIKYKNQSPAETWPGGTYKNYMRVLVPAGSILEKISDGENLSQDKVKIENFGDKQAFAFQIEVGVGKSKEIVLEYSLPVVLNFKENLADYNLIIQKQPGTENDPLAVDINYPNYMRAVSSNQKAQSSAQKLVFNLNLSKDEAFKIKLAREKKVVDTN